MKDDRNIHVLLKTDIECESQNLDHAGPCDCPFATGKCKCKVAKNVDSIPADLWIEDIHYEWLQHYAEYNG